MTLLSRKKRDEAFAVPSRNHTEMMNNRQKVGIRERNVTELVTIMKDDEPQSHVSSTRPGDNNGLVRTESGSKYPGLLVEAMSIKSIRRTWTTNLSFMGRKKSIQHEFEIVSDYPVSV